MSGSHNLLIKNFAQIAEVNIDFGDLTILVGAQATGKSIVLQWLKTILDGKHIIKKLADAGYFSLSPKASIDTKDFLDQVFGAGMRSALRPRSAIEFDGHEVKLENLARRGRGKSCVFFIPAQRSALLSNGWPLPFQAFQTDTPFVARLFSDLLFHRFSSEGARTLFPQDRMLKSEYREKIRDAFFRNASIELNQTDDRALRLGLRIGRANLPFMSWTAGQREFTPLLLSMYHLLTPRKEKKLPDIDWVVIEEPEMGLHPEAITVFMLLVLELLHRGYKVVISTHSPHLVTIVWFLQELKNLEASGKFICEAFDLNYAGGPKQVAESALQKNIFVHYFAYGDNQKNKQLVRSQDISELDVESADETVSGWGGLTELSSKFGESLSRAVNERMKVS